MASPLRCLRVCMRDTHVWAVVMFCLLSALPSKQHCPGGCRPAAPAEARVLQRRAGGTNFVLRACRACMMRFFHDPVHLLMMRAAHCSGCVQCVLLPPPPPAGASPCGPRGTLRGWQAVDTKTLWIKMRHVAGARRARVARVRARVGASRHACVCAPWPPCSGAGDLLAALLNHSMTQPRCGKAPCCALLPLAFAPPAACFVLSCLCFSEAWCMTPAAVHALPHTDGCLLVVMLVQQLGHACATLTDWLPAQGRAWWW